MSRRRTSRFWRLVGAILLLLIGVPSVYLLYQRLTMPRYQGETVEYWLEHATPGPGNFDFQAREKADEAFRALGPKAAPFLIEQYRVRLSSHGLRHKLMANPKFARFIYNHEDNLPGWLRNWLVRRDMIGRWKVQEYLSALGTNLIVVEAELAGLLQARYASEVSEVLQLLGCLGPAGWKSIPKVAPLLHHKDEKIRNEAAWTMGSLARPGDPHAALVQIAAQEGRIRPAMGVRTLDKMKASPVLLFPELGEQLLDTALQMEAIACIAELEQEKPLLIPALRTAFSAEDPQFRLRLVRVLGSMLNHPEAFDAVIHALSDEYYYVKAEAARCLGSVPSATAEALPALRRLLDDPHPDVRETAEAAITAIESQTARATAGVEN